MMKWPRLQRLDFHLAKFNHALVAGDAVGVLEPQAVLQRDPSTRKLGVLRAVDGLLPIEYHSERRALRRDLIDVPFAARFRHRIDLGDVDDRAGAILLHGPRVPDIHFVGGFAADVFWIGAANEDAAVSDIIDPELGAELKVGVAVLRDQKAVALVGNDNTVRELPVGVADLFPVIEVFAVEQRNPSATGLAGRLVRDRESSKPE